MRRLMITLCAVLAVALSASAASAAGNAFHFKASGPGAEGFWSTCPFEPGPNTVCTDTFLFTADQAVREDGTRFQDTFLFIDQFIYKFDRRGNFVFISETFGFASGADVSLVVDRNLTTANVDATVALETCDENFTCMDAGTGAVSASWTGVGELARVSEKFTFRTKTFMEKFTFRGKMRDAIATGDLDGVDFGDSLFADIFNATSSDLFVCHGC
jgi:hypothetical protein